MHRGTYAIARAYCHDSYHMPRELEAGFILITTRMALYLFPPEALNLVKQWNPPLPETRLSAKQDSGSGSTDLSPWRALQSGYK